MSQVANSIVGVSYTPAREEELTKTSNSISWRQHFRPLSLQMTPYPSLADKIILVRKRNIHLPGGTLRTKVLLATDMIISMNVGILTFSHV